MVHGYDSCLTFHTCKKCIIVKYSRAENFSNYSHQITIKDEGKIYTACEDGKIPFVSAADIGAVAFHVLTDIKPHNTEYRILGPELLTYDEVHDRPTGPVIGVIASSDVFHADCGEIQHRFGTQNCARQALRAREGETVHESAHAGTVREVSDFT